MATDDFIMRTLNLTPDQVLFLSTVIIKLFSISVAFYSRDLGNPVSFKSPFLLSSMTDELQRPHFLHAI